MTKFSGTLHGDPVEVEARDLGPIVEGGVEFYGTQFVISPYPPHRVLVDRRICDGPAGLNRRDYEERLSLRNVGVELGKQIA